MNKYISILFAISLAACGTPPKAHEAKIQSAPPDKIVSSPLEALKKSIQRRKGEKLSIELSEQDLLLKIGSKNAPYQVIDLEIKDPKKSYLVFSSFYQATGGMGEAAVVVPSIYMYDSNGKEIKTKLLQFGDVPLCTLTSRCAKTAFSTEIKEAGVYSVVVAAYVRDPSQVIASSNEIAPAGSVALVSVSRTLYPSYYGSVDVVTSDKLPLRR